MARRLDNGLSFSKDGYQLEPDWQMEFISNDSVCIYSPIKKEYINFPLTCGYDSIFNTARTWFKAREITRDSLLFQLIEAHADSIDTRGSNVYMTFYADNYIKNVIHKDTATVKAPGKQDTLFVKSLVDSAEKDYHKAFSARQPPIVESKSNLVKVTRRYALGDMLNNFDTSDNYMYPTYDIAINQAYANFYYSFSVFVDNRGDIHYDKPLIPFTGKGYEESYTALSKAVMERYLKKYLRIRPGSTLGMIHPSSISIHVEGKKIVRRRLVK
ncbi:hypothetical protein [Mucilaginibacter gossypii]|uniref:hypothetical protein n=1 Tax=Mucilaginibacter gossypii TaxID=551996 RepID=UPI00115FAD47|nr:hypothetical protein [Mucilaginibacter gossypii]